MNIRFRTVKMSPDKELWINVNDLLIALYDIEDSDKVSGNVKPGVRYVKQVLKKTIYDV